MEAGVRVAAWQLAISHSSALPRIRRSPINERRRAYDRQSLGRRALQVLRLICVSRLRANC